jgi:hypothetical protein
MKVNLGIELGPPAKLISGPHDMPHHNLELQQANVISLALTNVNLSNACCKKTLQG